MLSGNYINGGGADNASQQSSQSSQLQQQGMQLPTNQRHPMQTMNYGDGSRVIGDGDDIDALTSLIAADDKADLIGLSSEALYKQLLQQQQQNAGVDFADSLISGAGGNLQNPFLDPELALRKRCSTVPNNAAGVASLAELQQQQQRHQYGLNMLGRKTGSQWLNAVNMDLNSSSNPLVAPSTMADQSSLNGLNNNGNGGSDFLNSQWASSLAGGINDWQNSLTGLGIASGNGNTRTMTAPAIDFSALNNSDFFGLDSNQLLLNTLNNSGNLQKSNTNTNVGAGLSAAGSRFPSQSTIGTEQSVSLSNHHHHDLDNNSLQSLDDPNLSLTGNVGNNGNGHNRRVRINTETSQQSLEDYHSSKKSERSDSPNSDLGIKVNLDPRKRARSEPGVTLQTLKEHGIDPNQLDPTVLKRIRNTDSARRSRQRRQQRMNEMEVRLKELEERELVYKQIEVECHQLRAWKDRVVQWLQTMNMLDDFKATFDFQFSQQQHKQQQQQLQQQQQQQLQQQLQQQSQQMFHTGGVDLRNTNGNNNGGNTSQYRQ
ncbi:hypothetical protein MIR68_007758 [Amoeboaphelidium protococcarum]|nr:hypothetical protein MIR68_007758 [Amoeboaphelidium protococcarum]